MKHTTHFRIVFFNRSQCCELTLELDQELLGRLAFRPCFALLPRLLDADLRAALLRSFPACVLLLCHLVNISLSMNANFEEGA